MKVQPSKLSGEVTAPPSKSYTHRAFMVALLAKGESKILAPLLGLDTRATIDAARALGAEVVQRGDVWHVKGTGGKLKSPTDVIDAKNSGTTIRMMSAIAALSPKPVKLTGDESIQKRPMGPLVEALVELGAKAHCDGPQGRPPVIVGGGIDGGDVEITGSVSSQFISALLLAAPYAREDTKIAITEKMRSRPYVDITLELLDAAGAKVKRNKDLSEFSIPGGQVFKPLDITIPGDFSSAAFVLGAAALTGSTVAMNNLDVKGAQGDKRVVDFFRDFGVNVVVKEKSVQVSGSGEMSGIDTNCGDTPDLVPVLAVLGSVADGRTRLSDIPHLRMKETDRLRALAVGLREFGADVKELPDELQLRGVKGLKGAKVESFGDHRMAMAFAVAGLVAKGQTIVSEAESIPVSYPTFVEDMRKLGAKIELVK